MATPPQGEALSLGTRECGGGSGPELKATHGPPLPWQVGSFDPYSDDPRLGIQKIFLCKYSGYLAVAGTAGQVASRAGCGEQRGGVVRGSRARSFLLSFVWGRWGQQGQEPGLPR